MRRSDPLPALAIAGGGHSDRSNGLCSMELVAWLAGEPHSDHPQCACPVIGAFMRSWNDSLPDDDTRTRLLRPLLPLLVGSRSTPAVAMQRSWMAIDWLAREHTPAWLALRDDLKAHEVALRGLAPIADATSAKAAQPALDAAWVSRELVSPLTPAVVNGVVFAVSSGETSTARTGRSGKAVVYALDGATGKELWSSGAAIGSFVHGGALSVGNSQVYLGTHDGTLYAFGFPMEH